MLDVLSQRIFAFLTRSAPARSFFSRSMYGSSSDAATNVRWPILIVDSRPHICNNMTGIGCSACSSRWRHV
jgi:hypothetical protein